MSEGTQVAERNCEHERGCRYADRSPKEATLMITEVERVRTDGAEAVHWRCGDHGAELIRRLNGPITVRRVESLRYVNSRQVRDRLLTDIAEAATDLRSNEATPARVDALDLAIKRFHVFEGVP